MKKFNVNDIKHITKIVEKLRKVLMY